MAVEGQASGIGRQASGVGRRESLPVDGFVLKAAAVEFFAK